MDNKNEGFDEVEGEDSEEKEEEFPNDKEHFETESSDSKLEDNSKNSDEGKLEEENREDEKREENLDEEKHKERSEETGKRQNKQVKWSVFLMTSIILIVLIVPFVKTNFIDKFDYKGIDFQKTRLGDIRFYSARFPVVSNTGQVTGDYAVNLRNDPRELENIPINVTNEKIDFTLEGDKYGPVYLSLNPFMEVCEDSGIALITLSGFLRDSGLEVNSAVTDKAYAREHNQTHRWCHDSGFDTVVVITNGNETIINEIFPGCYEVKFKDCEIMQASERFMLNILEQYAARFQIN